jgi:hypothetical protein
VKFPSVHFPSLPPLQKRGSRQHRPQEILFIDTKCRVHHASRRPSVPPQPRAAARATFTLNTPARNRGRDWELKSLKAVTGQHSLLLPLDVLGANSPTAAPATCLVFLATVQCPAHKDSRETPSAFQTIIAILRGLQSASELYRLRDRHLSTKFSANFCE